MVFLMSVSVTSLCLHLVYTKMLHVELCFRLLLYAFYVCCHCYQGMPGESIVKEIPNLVLFGGILLRLLPVLLLYVSMAVTIAAYTRLLSTPTRKTPLFYLLLLAVCRTCLRQVHQRMRLHILTNKKSTTGSKSATLVSSFWLSFKMSSSQ